MRVMTVGCWDLLHVGHTNLFRRCIELSSGKYRDFTIGVNSDRFVMEYKGITTHDSEDERMRKVAPFGIPFLHDNNMKADIRRWEPDFLVVGSDWATKDYHAQIMMAQSELDELNVSVVYVPQTPGISSTKLREERSVVGKIVCPVEGCAFPYLHVHTQANK